MKRNSLFSLKDCDIMLEPQAGMQVGEILEWAEYAEKADSGTSSGQIT